MPGGAENSRWSWFRGPWLNMAEPPSDLPATPTQPTPAPRREPPETVVGATPSPRRHFSGGCSKDTRSAPPSVGDPRNTPATEAGSKDCHAAVLGDVLPRHFLDFEDRRLDWIVPAAASEVSVPAPRAVRLAVPSYVELAQRVAPPSVLPTQGKLGAISARLGAISAQLGQVGLHPRRNWMGLVPKCVFSSEAHGRENKGAGRARAVEGRECGRWKARSADRFKLRSESAGASAVSPPAPSASSVPPSQSASAPVAQMLAQMRAPHVGAQFRALRTLDDPADGATSRGEACRS